MRRRVRRYLPLFQKVLEYVNVTQLTSVKCMLIVYRKRHHSTRETTAAKSAVEYSVFLDHRGNLVIAQGFKHLKEEVFLRLFRHILPVVKGVTQHL